MSLNQSKNVIFGSPRANATGSSGVGYTILDTTGSIVAARSTSGIHQLASGSGTYSAYVSFPDDFHGSILWDTGTAFTSVYYASEQINAEENNPNVDTSYNTLLAMSASLETIRGFTEGRWHIIGTQMLFYDRDNTTLLGTFDLNDINGLPTNDAVFERVRK